MAYDTGYISKPKNRLWLKQAYVTLKTFSCSFYWFSFDAGSFFLFFIVSCAIHSHSLSFYFILILFWLSFSILTPFRLVGSAKLHSMLECGFKCMANFRFFFFPTFSQMFANILNYTQRNNRFWAVWFFCCCPPFKRIYVVRESPTDQPLNGIKNEWRFSAWQFYHALNCAYPITDWWRTKLEQFCKK